MVFIWNKVTQPIFFNEVGKLVNYKNLELDEQILSDKYIEPDDVVLELGARYGTVSYAINNKLNIKTNHVAVEPDPTVWTVLEHNLNINKCGTNIVKGFISREKIGLNLQGYSGYASSFTKDNATFYPDCFTLEEIESKYNLKFNTLVADCEGGLEIFLDENKKLYKTLKLVMFEEDQPHKCDYNKIRKCLFDNGFIEIETRNIQHVWKKL